MNDATPPAEWDPQALDGLEASPGEAQALDLPPELLLGRLQAHLDAGRIHPFLHLVQRLASELAAEGPEPRLATARLLDAAAAFAEDPGLPGTAVEALAELLLPACAREADPAVHAFLLGALERLCWHWVARGESERVRALLRQLLEPPPAGGEGAPWRAQALGEMVARLGSPERLDLVLAQVRHLNPGIAAARLQPYLGLVGEPARRGFLARLREEGDREQRQRMALALERHRPQDRAALVQRLQSGTEEEICEALLLLAERSGSAQVPDLLPALAQASPAVVRCAIRAIGRLGGGAAARALIPFLRDREMGHQEEALLTFGEARCAAALPAILARLGKLRGRKGPGPDRLKAAGAWALGRMDDPAAVPLLLDLLRRRGHLFWARREPAPVRLAALQALLDLGTPEARAGIARILAAEPPGPEREAWRALVGDART